MGVTLIETNEATKKIALTQSNQALCEKALSIYKTYSEIPENADFRTLASLVQNPSDLSSELHKELTDSGCVISDMAANDLCKIFWTLRNTNAPDHVLEKYGISHSEIQVLEDKLHNALETIMKDNAA